MQYTLNVKETGNKSAKYHYTITDEQGNVISERRSDRKYVAATITGSHYFGRVDLVGKGDHGNYLKMCKGYRRDFKKGKWVWEFDPAIPQHEPLPVAYLKTEENSQ